MREESCELECSNRGKCLLCINQRNYFPKSFSINDTYETKVIHNGSWPATVKKRVGT
jgi:hypothetical protein